jgi:small subunit ribosomal protein S16
MSVKIRLTRLGAKKRPFYRVVIANSTAPRDGKFIEIIGTYDPMLAKESPERVKLKQDRVQYWLSVGAQPTDRVAKLIKLAAS